MSPSISIVVLQPTPFCNIDCKYCYLPERDAKTVMPLETIVAAFERIFASGWVNPQLTVIWHAGEPLVVPPSYYQAAFEAIEKLRPDFVELRHSIQTNGMLLNAEWCEFFREWHMNVGVSVDGPRELHDANRVTRAGKGTFDKTIAGIRLLRREHVPFHVISVLGAKSMNMPEEMLDFYISEGIDDVCFNVEESEGTHVSTLLTGSDPVQSFRKFLDKFWTLSRESGRIQFVREIDGMIRRIFRPEGTEVDNAQVEPFGMVNIDCHGNVSSFSPELLGYKNVKYDNFTVGNVHRHSMAEMFESPAMQAMARDISAGVRACASECEYFSVCGGGAPVNKLTENGSFASTRTMFCSLIQIVPTDLILNALDRLEMQFDRATAVTMAAGAAGGGSYADPVGVEKFNGTRRAAANGAFNSAAAASVEAGTNIPKFRPEVPDVALHQIQRGSR
ncbi:MAG TPA: cyclophane-forming radical SAM/SPASM peptide maturase GrrM/OscB [Candidatus Acidoferrales bacterium]